MGFQKPYEDIQPRQEKPTPDEVERIAPHIGEDAINAGVPVETGSAPIAVTLIPSAEQPAQPAETPQASAPPENGDIKRAA